MNLAANILMLHNMVDLTKVFKTMASEGYVISKTLVAALSSYMREHLAALGKFIAC